MSPHNSVIEEPKPVSPSDISISNFNPITIDSKSTKKDDPDDDLPEMSKVATEDIEKMPSVFKSHFQEIVSIITFTFAPGCVTMAMGAYTVSISDIMNDFNIKGSSSAWLVGSISLANGSTLILMGSLSDAIGRKNCIVAGFSLYAVFSLIGGFMQSLVSLCILRALSGVAISLSLTSSFGLVGATYAEGSRRKNRFNAIISAGNPLGSVVGNFCGAICVQFVGSWRAAHYFFAILYALLTLVALYSVPSDNGFDLNRLKKVLKSLDYMGALLSLASLTLICFSLTQVDATKDKWHTPYIIALLTVGILLLIAFLLWECYIPKKPLIPMKIFSNNNFSICAVIMALTWTAFTGMFTYYSILYLEQILDNSPILTAVKVMPMFIMGTIINIIAAFTLHLIKGQVIMAVGCTGLVACMIIFATLDIHRNYWLGFFWCTILSVIGADLIWNVASLVTYSSVTKELQSSASGLLNMLMMLASVVGLGISSAIISGVNDDYGTDRQYDDLHKLFDSFKKAFYFFAIATTSLALVFTAFLDVGKFKKEKKPIHDTEV